MAKLKPIESTPESPDTVQSRIAAGYIEYPNGSRCGTCEYSSDRASAQALCTKWNFSISNANGCCDDWIAFDKQGKDYRKDEEEANESGERPGSTAEPAAGNEGTGTSP